MPHMKQFYARYHNRGLEIIGVSLDPSREERGVGLDGVRQYVKANGIAWPQYYQGKSWDAEFSRSWGINVLPAMFVIDAAGNLAAILGGDTLKDQLDRVVPALLEKNGRRAAAPASGG
jgi:Thioredoxin-like